MTRKLREGEYDSRPVEACAVAPHRYRRDRTEDNPHRDPADSRVAREALDRDYFAKDA